VIYQKCFLLGMLSKVIFHLTQGFEQTTIVNDKIPSSFEIRDLKQVAYT